jgi:hypothetical protein
VAEEQQNMLEHVLDFLGCCHKTSQTGWFNNINLFLIFWRLEAQGQGASMARFWGGSFSRLQTVFLPLRIQ